MAYRLDYVVCGLLLDELGVNRDAFSDPLFPPDSVEEVGLIPRNTVLLNVNVVRVWRPGREVDLADLPIPDRPVDRDELLAPVQVAVLRIPLRGRGLRQEPSVFAFDHPVTLADQEDRRDERRENNSTNETIDPQHRGYLLFS